MDETPPRRPLPGTQRPVPHSIGNMFVPPNTDRTEGMRPVRVQSGGGGGGFGRFIAIVVLLVGLVAGAGIAADRLDLDLFDAVPSRSRTAADATPEPPPPPLDVAAVTASVSPTLVNIDVTVGPLDAAGAGTGIVLTSEGHVLTSHHVIKGAQTITVTDVGNGLVYDAIPLGYDSLHDIALLQLTNATDLPTARVGNSDRVRVGDEVVAMGNAGGLGGNPTTSPGRTTDLNGSIIARNEYDYSRKMLENLIEIEADVHAGQSGGALVNTYGEVVGVIAAAALRPEPDEDEAAPQTPVPGDVPAQPEPTQAYAVPINQAMSIVDQIRSGQRSETVHIGPTATLGALVRDSSIDGRDGAFVELALYDSPAFEAGLRNGDVITAIDEKVIDSTKTLRIELSNRSPGQTIRLAVIDEDGESRSVTLVLADGPPN